MRRSQPERHFLTREQQFESAALTPSPIEGASMDADLGLLLTAVYVTV